MEESPKTGWYEGVFIMVGMIIVVVVPALHDLCLLKRSHTNFKRKSVLVEQTLVDVFRASCKQQISISISDLIPGDVLLLKTGCLVPADGVLISGDFLVLHDGLESVANEGAPFLFNGSMVTNGSGRMLITSVGMNTAFGERMNLATATARTPDNRTIQLAAELDKLKKVTHVAGLLISILILVVLFLRFIVCRNNGFDSDLPEIKGKPNASKDIMDVMERIVMKERGKISTNIIALLTVILVGIMEGVPLVITFSHIYLRKKMLSDKASDPGLLASVTMGFATTICTDITLLNRTEVAKCFIGTDEVIQPTGSNIPTQVREALGNGISVPLIMPSTPCNVAATEDRLLTWANSNLGINLDTSRQSFTVIKTNRLSSNEEGSGVLMKNIKEKTMSLHLKGPFAFACKQIDAPDVEENGLLLIAMVGLKKNRCCDDIKEALKAFQAAGVKIMLVSEGHASELEDIANAYEIRPLDGLVIPGEDLKNYDEQERMNEAEKMYGICNSDSSHKQRLMQYLKETGNVVVALGSRTNDIAMLRAADLGVAMGTWSSQMARESSNLVILDGSFGSLLTVTSFGRCTYKNIQKYIQLELTTNIAGTLIASITTMWLGSNSITSIQLFWANFLITLVAGPALLMEPPQNELKQKPPTTPTEPLISISMWRNIVIQALYQTTILISFQFKGKALLGFFNITKQHVSKSMIFNSFVVCQIFNQVNSRELEKINILKGILQNPWFPLAVVSTLGLQVSFIEVAHALVGDERLNLAQWGICLLIGAVSCPADSAAKRTWNLIKNRHFGFHTRSPTVTHSAPSDSVSNLELTGMSSTANSTSAPS